jgi:hypothetical protein
MRLQNVEQHLQRLDEEIRAANQRALVYLEYKARAPRSFDKLLAKACAGVITLDEEHIALPAALPIEPLGPQWLATPPRPPLANTGTLVTRSAPSIEALALDALRKRMIDARLVTPLVLASYVAVHLGSEQVVESDALNIASIRDLACYQRLLLIASRSAAPAAVVATDPFAQMVPGMRVRFADGMTANGYLRHRRFVIQREQRLCARIGNVSRNRAMGPSPRTTSRGRPPAWMRPTSSMPATMVVVRRMT